MHRLLRALAPMIFGLLCIVAQSHAQTTTKALIVYDAPTGDAYEKLGAAYAIMLRNLLGHFDGTVDAVPVQNYAAGQVENYDTMFYLGVTYDNPLPASFLQDVSATSKTVVWFRYNIWKLAWDAAYNFTSKYGLNFTGLRGMNAAPTSSNPSPGFFDTIVYKNRNFVKYYAFNSGTGAINADPDIGVMQITDPARAINVSTVRNGATNEQVPYVVRSGNFWYFADIPFSYIGPRDRYLVAADLLHDIVGINHAEQHMAMVRLEDVGALVSVQDMRTLGNYLKARSIPYSIGAIPHYMDPLGKYNNGISQSIPLSQATNLRRALTDALSRGGEVMLHGNTHQYDSRPNPHSGVSGDDFEFWDAVNNSPVAEDSTAWAAARIQSGRDDFIAHGYNPIAWVTPHYQASALSSKAVPPIFSKTYQRVVYYTSDVPNFSAAQGRDFAVGQFFPYIINRDYYGQKVLPENLGNIEYDISDIDPTSNLVYTWQDIHTNAQYALAVRDGFGSFFFHPFWLEPELNVPGFQDFQNLVNGITNLGYTWTSPSRLP